jgi:hypothetical protein
LANVDILIVLFLFLFLMPSTSAQTFGLGFLWEGFSECFLERRIGKKGQSRLGVLFLPRFICLSLVLYYIAGERDEICFIGINPLFHILNIGVISHSCLVILFERDLS